MRHCSLLALDALQMFDDDDEIDDNDECAVLVAAATKSSSSASDDYCVKQFNFFTKSPPVCGKYDVGKCALEFVIRCNFIN